MASAPLLIFFSWAWLGRLFDGQRLDWIAGWLRSKPIVLLSEFLLFVSGVFCGGIFGRGLLCGLDGGVF